MNSNCLTITFNPEDLANSEVWWIKGYWKVIKKLWKETKKNDLEIVTKDNVMEFIEFNMKIIMFGLGGNNE